MVCTYKFFKGDSVWKNQTDERSLLWCTSLIFTCAYEHCFILPVVVQQSTQYSQDINYIMPSYWIVHNSPSGYMDRDDWHKSMAHFPSMCSSSALNPQVLFYDGRVSHFHDRALHILCRHNIQYFILKSGDYVHEQPNDNGPNMKLMNFMVMKE